MLVILREGHEKLGIVGAEVNVADGYARNFLIPRKIVAKATEANRIAIKNELKQQGRKLAREKGEALSLCEKIAALSISFEKKAGAEGKLFGSVTSQEIAGALKEKGFEIDRKKLEIGQAIKTVGNHVVKIRLHHEIKAELTIEVRADEIATDDVEDNTEEGATEEGADEVVSEEAQNGEE